MTHIVGYRDGTSFSYGGVVSITYTETAIIFCGNYMVVSLDLKQVLMMHVLPENNAAVQLHPNGWSHDPHARRFD